MSDDVQPNSFAFANCLLDMVSQPSEHLPGAKVDPEAVRNAAALMTEFLCARLARDGEAPEHLERTTFRWGGGVVNMRNAVQNEHWTNLRTTFVNRFREMTEGGPSVYLMSAWQPECRMPRFRAKAGQCDPAYGSIRHPAEVRVYETACQRSFCDHLCRRQPLDCPSCAALL